MFIRLARVIPPNGLRFPLVPQAVLGSPNWPWRPINEHDARHVDRRDGRAGRGSWRSPHDSTPSGGRRQIHHHAVGNRTAALLRPLRAHPSLAGLVLTEVNPTHDADGSQITRYITAIAEVLAS